MRLKKTINLLLAIALCAALALPTYAADNSEVDKYISRMEEKFGIRITYQLNSAGQACIGTGNLATLESGLNTITPEVVKQVSNHMQKQLGNKLTYKFMYSVSADIPSVDDAVVLGRFDESTGVMEIFMPSNSTGTYSSGCNPVTMAHEFAHALNMLVRASYGEVNLEREWTALNGNNPYNNDMGSDRFSETTFVSKYATFDFHEDFAETFAHSIVRNHAGLGFSYLLSKDGAKTKLGKKIDYMANILSKTLQNSDNLVANIKNNSYNTPVYTEYKGISLYGVNMQYIGCSSPKHVLKGILGAINDDAKTSHWASEIGGWYVEAISGKYYLIFPGGTVQQLKAPLNAAA